MNILVTGAHGFLGSHIAETLLARGHAVRALASPWGEIGNLGRILSAVDLRRADITEADGLRAACRGVETVIHAAARVADWGSQETFFATNVQGTRNLLQAATAEGVRRFVLISSVAVHRNRGFQDQDPRTLPRDNFANPYAWSKILAEDEVMTQRALEPVIIRPGLWPFGTRDPNFTRLVRGLRRGRLPLLGQGSARLNTSFAPNLAYGIALAAEVPEANGRTYLIADAGAPTWTTLFAALASLLEVSPPWLHLPPGLTAATAAVLETSWKAFLPAREPPLTRYRAELMRHDMHFHFRHATAELGYTPPVSWQEGLERSLETLHRQRATLA